jgi:ABC-type amino acid transport substrate-binding protein
MKTKLISFTTTVATLCILASGVTAATTDARKTIVFASPQWAPYVFQNGKGTTQGVYIDILNEIFAKNLQLPVTYIEYPWKRAQIAVKEGLADLIITVATPDRLQYAVRSDSPVLEMYLHVFTYTRNPRLSEIESITSGEDILKMGLIPVTNLGNVWHKNHIDHLGVATRYVPNEENAFLFLAAQRADITIEPLIAGSYLIKQLDLADRITPTKARFGPLTFHLLLSKKSSHLKRMGEINQVIKSLHQSGRMQRIYERYQHDVQ